MRKKVLSAVFAVALLVAIAVPLSGGGSALAHAPGHPGGCVGFGAGTSVSAKGDNPTLPNPGDLGDVISADPDRAGSVHAAQQRLCH